MVRFSPLLSETMHALTGVPVTKSVVSMLPRVYNVEGECRTALWPVKNEPVECFRIFTDAYVYLCNLEWCR